MEQDALQSLLADFAKEVESKIRSSASKYGFSRNIKVRIKKTQSGDFVMATQLPKYSVLRHKGVGRGRGINSGKTIPDEFLNRVLDQEMPRLAEIVATHFQDLQVNASRSLIQ
jgi:hypothetical protein